MPIEARSKSQTEASLGAGLEVQDLHVRYGRVHALRGVSLNVAPGEIVAVLGANGAGKSSLLKTLIGLQTAAGGRVSYGGADITGWAPSRRLRSNLVLVPEGRRIVTSLTVHENLLMGAFTRLDRRAVATELLESSGTARPCRRGAVRGRAADARDRSRFACRASPDDARRTVTGLESAAHQRGFCAFARSSSRTRARAAFGRTEYLQSTRTSGSSLRPRAWSDRHGRRAGTAACRPVAARRLSRRR